VRGRYWIEGGLSSEEKEGWAGEKFEGRGGDRERRREAVAGQWRRTIRFRSVYLQVVINVLRGWVVLGFVCLSGQLYLTGWVKDYCVGCSFMSRFECRRACDGWRHWAAEELGCVSAKISSRYLEAPRSWDVFLKE